MKNSKKTIEFFFDFQEKTGSLCIFTTSVEDSKKLTSISKEIRKEFPEENPLSIESCSLSLNKVSKRILRTGIQELYPGNFKRVCWKRRKQLPVPGFPHSENYILRFN